MGNISSPKETSHDNLSSSSLKKPQAKLGSSVEAAHDLLNQRLLMQSSIYMGAQPSSLLNSGDLNAY